MHVRTKESGKYQKQQRQETKQNDHQQYTYRIQQQKWKKVSLP